MKTWSMWHRSAAVGGQLVLGGILTLSAQYRIAPVAGGATRPLDPTLFPTADSPGRGWTVGLDLAGADLSPGSKLLELRNEGGDIWLQASTVQTGTDTRVDFALKTTYKSEPLTLTVPVRVLNLVSARKLLLRYRGNSLDLFLDGVLVDQEWPLGKVQQGNPPQVTLLHTHADMLIWNRSLSDRAVEQRNGGTAVVAARATQILGPEPKYAQYSRPRGFNTNAGDTMPFYHNGRFHLFFLLDRRQHRSKWTLGAHQWGHISSTDLTHWTQYPVAIGIDHDWESSICTGSVFFDGKQYYAFYATRLPDRSEHLAMATSSDGIHFSKVVPSPLGYPKPPFVPGPNRDPFVFRAGGTYHMIVTAAVGGGHGKDSQGVMEHLTSSDLYHWTVLPEPFLVSGTNDQPECSDLFRWGDWYYLLYSIGGVTHYKMAKDPLGPWSTPTRNILDGPEARVMKAADYHDGRHLAVGFVTHDQRWGGDLVFRELVQETDGVLGTKFPKEMMPSVVENRPLPSVELSSTRTSSTPIPLTGSNQVTATLLPGSQARFALALDSEGPNRNDRLIFDSVAHTVTWTGASPHDEATALLGVTDFTQPLNITFVSYGTVADIMINGHRTMIHRLAAVPQKLSFQAVSGTVSIRDISAGSLQ